MRAVHVIVYGVLSPFSGWLVLGRVFPCTRLLCLLWFVQGSLFPLLVHVMFCWFPACTASLSCSFLIYTFLTFDQKTKVNKNWVGGDWEIVNEKVPKVTSGFFSAPNPCWLRNCEWKWSHYRLPNHERNHFRRCRVDWLALTAPSDLEIVNENWFVADSEIIT